jgi:hypothetical protein
MRSDQFIQGKRHGVKWAITWLHQLAAEMNDPHAQAILNSAALGMGVEAKRADAAGELKMKKPRPSAE